MIFGSYSCCNDICLVDSVKIKLSTSTHTLNRQYECENFLSLTPLALLFPNKHPLVKLLLQGCNCFLMLKNGMPSRVVGNQLSSFTMTLI